MHIDQGMEAAAIILAVVYTRYLTKACSCGAVTSVLAGSTTRSIKAEKYGWVTVFVSDAGVELYYDNGRLIVPCRACGSNRYATRVAGKVSKKHVCGSKCMSSTGFVCECSCGGKNHGAGYGG